ncbi:translocation/assembly module TamB domain-containing protein [Siphonobacter sp. SORGH_AS_0500]|uniref:translocation/assembly module TamB domain-containing protein n=2 Tax=Siphonobacter sp. SORGH_AS_0500 TaxID=1864824 RepID=UPI00285EF653|nr:translocation/assembly module TamB domain-containing protein [Siphonobacter sp. SORGH_AS_0500]MDR6194088.1 translocation and assembly module TamB [Siphonobacter sp. SORGH_AS_0500]
MNIRKILKISLASIGGLLLLVIAFLLVLGLTPWGQNFVTKQANRYLSSKLNTPFRIGKISYQIPDWIQLEDVYFQTPKGDTLLSGGRLRVDLDMLGLIQGRVALNQIELDKIRLNVTRTLPDTAFNFNFLIDAFSSGAPADPADTSSAPLALSLSGVGMNDVRIHYVDDIAGADIHFAVDTLTGKFDEINPAESRYHVNEIKSSGLVAKARIYKGIDIPGKVNDAATVPGDTMDLRMGDWQLSRTAWNIRAEEAGFSSTGKVGQLNLAGDQLYLEGQQALIRSLELMNSQITATLDKTAPQPEAPPAPNNKEKPQDPNAGWKAKIGRVRFANNDIKFDNDNNPRQPKGLDYSHIDIKGFTLAGEELVYQPNLISGKLRQGKFREKSGVNLQRFDADVFYSPQQIGLTNFIVQTPGTLLKDKLIIKFDSLGQLTRAAEAKRVLVDVNMTQNRISFADIITLVPSLAQTTPLKGNEKAVLNASIQAKGSLADLNLPLVEFSILSSTKVKAHGKVSYPTDPEKMGLNIVLENATTSSADVKKLAPKGSLPDSISIPAQLKLAGTAKGRLNAIDLDIAMNSSYGNLSFDGQLKNFVTGKNQAYAGTANIQQLDLGKWLMQPQQFGAITATATVNGRGIDPKTMSTTFDVNVPEAMLQGYTYRQFAAKGSLNQGLLDVKGGINDPNARLNLVANANMKGEFPTVKGTVAIEQLDLHALKLYTDPFQVQGNIQMDFASTNPEKLIGTLRTENLNINLKGENYPVDSLYLTANAEGTSKTIIARTPFAELDLGGNFQYADLAAAALTEVNKYVTIPDMKVEAPKAPTDFTLKMRVRQHPLLLAFVPGLTRLEPVKIEATLDSKRADSTLNISVTAGPIEYDTMLVAGANLKLASTDGKLVLQGQVGEIRKQSLHLYPTNITASAAQNQLQFKVMNKDSVNNDRFGIAGRVGIQGDAYELHLDRQALLTNYQYWTSDTTGYIRYNKAGVVAEKFRLETNNQALIVNSTEPTPNAPLHVELKNLVIGDLLKLANQDSTMAGGLLNGDVVVKDYLGTEGTNKKLSFTGDLKVDSLNVMQKNLGNLQAKFANMTDDRIQADVTLVGEMNDVHVGGFYNPSSTDQALDLNVELRRLDTRTIEAFSFGQLRETKGALQGEMTVKGAVDKPRLNGQINFNDVGFNVKFVNESYTINDEAIVFDNQTIRFNKFDLKDREGHAFTTDGTVNIANLPDVSYSLQVTANQFNVLNASRRDNELVYGNASLTTNLRIRGTGSTPSVTGNLKVEDGSKITMVIPDSGPSAEESAGIITFIQPNDSTALAKYLRKPKADTLNTKITFDQLANSNISIDVEINDATEFNVIVDEQSGDNLRAKGNARLNVTMDDAGNIGLFGRYDVTEGAYSLTYQVLKRDFEIEKGSSIVFSGDPLKATLDITALYRIQARVSELIAGQTNGQDIGTSRNLYANKLPFDVALKMEGNLAAPKLSFDVMLPEGATVPSAEIKEAVQAKLVQFRKDPSEINKQVFALLVLGSFLPENSFDFFSGSSGGGSLINAENLARTSVSKILSQQLDRLASNVIKGVDLNVGLNSSSDYANNNAGQNAQTAGSTATKTDLNIGLSKSFFNGRLSVSVGKNFVLEDNTGVERNNAQVFDNISVNYNITRDGRYMVRAYRVNELENILEGYVIETGLGFVINLDYNTFNQIFGKKKVE